jgi:hypothetical protein
MSLILTIQGCFYVIMGAWPILHMMSFETVSGPKKDKWLVKTVGLMICCSGIIFLKFADTDAAKLLAILNAICLGSIDVYYVIRRVIWKTYLIDAVIEAGFIIALLIT